MIKQYISDIRKNELMMGSIVITLLIFLGNLCSYGFQVLMTILLEPRDYSIVAIITAIIGIFAIPTMAIQTVISKNTTELKVKKQEGKIHGLMNYSLKKMFRLSLYTYVIYALVFYFIAPALKINYLYLLISGIFIFAAFTSPVLTGILQGLKKFREFGINFFIGCFVKFVAGVVLVFVGLGVYGAIMGFLLGIFAAFIILFLDIDTKISAKPEEFKIKIFSKDNFYPLVAMTLIVLFYSLDVVFARLFFSGDIAGKYSVFSLIGKTIFFVVTSIGTAMFPINTERHVSGGNTKSVFRKSMLFSILICLVAIALFLIFPHFVIQTIFRQKSFLDPILLVYCAIAFSFSSLLYLTLLNSISTNKLDAVKIVSLFLLFFVEIILFMLVHQTIEQFVIGFMISNIIAFAVGYFILRK